jgi:hypothetical protein
VVISSAAWVIPHLAGFEAHTKEKVAAVITCAWQPR